MTQSRKSALLGQIAHLKRVSAKSPADEDAFFRVGRERRIAFLEEEVAAVENAPNAAAVTVTFSGESVDGSSSMGVPLLARTMTAFKDIVGLLRGSSEGLPATPTGRPRSAKTDDLHFTRVALGSFGYELAVRHPSDLLSGDSTGQAIGEAIDLSRAAGTDEEAFLSAVDDRPPQLFAKLKAIVSPIKRDRGTVRLVTDTRELTLDRDEVVLAYERITQTVTEDYTDTLSGIFQGVLMASRKFEFAPEGGGPTLSGNVDEELDDDRLAAFDRDFINETVRATFRVIVVKARSGAEKRSWILLDVRG